MRRSRSKCQIDHTKAAETRAAKRAAKEAAGLTLGWTRKLAIFSKCMECMNMNRNEVAQCGCVDCPLWPFRNRRGITPREFKHWEKQYSESVDGRIFLRRLRGGDDSDGDGSAGIDSVNDVLSMEW